MRLGKSSMPKMPGGATKAPAKGGSAGFSMKHKLRKGTEFQGMSASDAGMGDQMSDYARALAAGGGL